MKAVLSTVTICLLLSIQPVHACSFSWKPGNSPQEIPHRTDVWKANGDFILIDAKTGEVVDDGQINLTEVSGELLGRLDRKRGKPIMTKQYFYEEWMVDCGMALTPQQRATGTFWLEKMRDKQGRYRLLMWRPAKQQSSPETESTQSDGN